MAKTDSAVPPDSPPNDRDDAPSRRVRVALGVVGAALVLAGFAVPTVRAAGGGESLEGWWLAQAGFAVALGGQGFGRPTRRAALFAALFLLATAAQLALTTPLWLQYLDLRPKTLRQGTAPIAVVVLLGQCVVVAWSLRGRVRTAAASLRSLVSPRAACVLSAVFLVTAAHVSPLFRPGGAGRIPDYLVLVAAALVLLCLNAANLLLCVEAVPAQEAARWRARLASMISLPGDERPATTADVWFPRLLAVGFLVAATLVAVCVFDRVPHIPDEAGYLFHARCLADGRITVPAPAVHEAFDLYLLDVRGGQWFDAMNPGWPAVLALGVRAGAPWLVNPLLGAACILLLHSLARRWTDRGTAHFVTLLLATSPWFLFLSGSFMTHTVTLALLLGAWRLLAPSKDGPRPAAAGLAGILLGAILLVRPLDGLVAGAVTGAWLLFAVRPRWIFALYALGCVAGSIWILPYNARLTGDPLRDPLNSYMDRLWYPGVNRLGFGADVGNVSPRWVQLDPLPGHGPLDVLVNANQNLYNLNFELTGWMAASLALLAVHLAWGRWSRLDRGLGVLAAAIVAALSAYWFSGGPDFGPRYWFFVIVPCLWLTCRGASTLAGLVRDRIGVEDASVRVGLAVGLLVFVSVVTFDSWRCTARYVDYRGWHGDYRRIVESGRLGRSLVLVRATADADAWSALAMNPPTLDPDGPLFARDLGPDVERRLHEAFRDRPVIHMLGRSVTGTAARVDDRR